LAGAIGPAGRAGTFKDMAKQVQYIDRSIENIYNEMGTHIARMTQLQTELDSLRDTVRQLASRSAK
jgi:peptidoglycan hydrolase CwlO-like protein